MEKLCWIIKSYTWFTDPAVEFSMGRIPYWHIPCSMAENTPSKFLKYRIMGLLKIFSQASWE